MLEYGGTYPQLGAFKIHLDENGWCSILQLCLETKQKEETIRDIINNPSDDKDRFQLYKDPTTGNEFVRRYPEYASGPKEHGFLVDEQEPPTMALPYNVFGNQAERAATKQQK